MRQTIPGGHPLLAQEVGKSVRLLQIPEDVCKAIYTTNAIDAMHRQFRKLTKTKGGFPNENSLLKLLYAGTLNASEKWTHPVQNWSLTLSQLENHFEDQIEPYLDL